MNQKENSKSDLEKVIDINPDKMSNEELRKAKESLNNLDYDDLVFSDLKTELNSIKNTVDNEMKKRQKEFLESEEFKEHLKNLDGVGDKTVEKFVEKLKCNRSNDIQSYISRSFYMEYKDLLNTTVYFTINNVSDEIVSDINDLINRLGKAHYLSEVEHKVTVDIEDFGCTYGDYNWKITEKEKVCERTVRGENVIYETENKFSLNGKIDANYSMKQMLSKEQKKKLKRENLNRELRDLQKREFIFNRVDECFEIFGYDEYIKVNTTINK